MSKVTLAAVAALACLTIVTPVAAADPPAATPSATPAAPSSPPTDVVVLKNGDMVRGVIVELSRGKEVVIQLATGSTRTYSWDQVEYAGSDAERPKTAAAPPAKAPESADKGSASSSQARPFVTVNAKPARLKLEANLPNVGFHVRTASVVLGNAKGNAVGEGYTEVCIAPCEATLPAGTHQLALSSDSKSAVPTDSPVVIQGDSVLKGEYNSRAGLRTVGWVIGIGANAAGLACLFASSDDNRDTMFALSLVGIGVGLVGFMIPAFAKDAATVTVSPLPAPPPHANASAGERLRGVVPSGAMVNAVF